MKNFNTKNWVIGLLVGSFIATFAVGFLHKLEVLSELANPIIHTFQDWLAFIIFLLPVAYIITRIMPANKTKELSTKNWIIGILTGALIAVFVVGSLHGIGILPLVWTPSLTIKEWPIIAVILLPISYGIARLIPSK